MAGPDAGAPAAPRRDAAASWLALPSAPGFFLEVTPHGDANRPEVAQHVMPVVEAMIDLERSGAALSGELATRYQEIDLLYSIGDLLGGARPVEEVAGTILREVASVVGARSAAIRLCDEDRGVLRAVATLGAGASVVPPEIAVDDPEAVVARAYRSGATATGTNPGWIAGEIVALPIVRATAGGAIRPVGTIALADRGGGGAFTQDETRLIAAVATQIGSAVENARLAGLERDRMRLDHELRVAHELQQRLMPTPSVLRGDADVAVRSEAAASVGGDFYTFGRLGRRRVGILLGDVSSHGLPAALIAAQVLAAAGIHGNATTPPDEMLTLLRASLADELAKTEMYLTVFYAILDPGAGRLVYASGGHAHAFRIPASGDPERLGPTAPPLGLAEHGRFTRRMVRWNFGADLLVLFTDGLTEPFDDRGHRAREADVIALIARHRAEPPARIVDQVWGAVAEADGAPRDDRTLLVLRM